MAQVYVSLGSNIHAEANICSCTQHLQARFKQVISSDVYQTPAQGFEGDAFLNSVVGFETDMGIDQLRKYLRNLEELHGRTRSGEKYASRTLDVDLLLYDEVIMGPEDNLPHSDILEYSFVLLPLAEIAPEQTHPVLNKNFNQLANTADFNKTRMVAVDINCKA